MNAWHCQEQGPARHKQLLDFFAFYISTLPSWGLTTLLRAKWVGIGFVFSISLLSLVTLRYSSPGLRFRCLIQLGLHSTMQTHTLSCPFSRLVISYPCVPLEECSILQELFDKEVYWLLGKICDLCSSTGQGFNWGLHLLRSEKLTHKLFHVLFWEGRWKAQGWCEWKRQKAEFPWRGIVSQLLTCCEQLNNIWVRSDVHRIKHCAHQWPTPDNVSETYPTWVQWRLETDALCCMSQP